MSIRIHKHLNHENKTVPAKSHKEALRKWSLTLRLFAKIRPCLHHKIMKKCHPRLCGNFRVLFCSDTRVLLRLSCPRKVCSASNTCLCMEAYKSMRDRRKSGEEPQHMDLIHANASQGNHAPRWNIIKCIILDSLHSASHIKVLDEIYIQLKHSHA
jgi:hypothetical protein